jgi:cysteine desulfurase
LKFPIYLDSHATTPVDPRVLEEMLPYFTEKFGNAASVDHQFGADAANAVDKSRRRIAKCINASPDDIIFTSGATESNNIIIQSMAQRDPAKNHIITCATEHKSILDTCKHLQTIGKEITYIPVDTYGIINLEALEEAINEKTALVTVMTANNEIGTIAPIKEASAIAHKHNVPFHTDATQAVGHIPFDVGAFNIDFVSISAHKIYGPKGVGALFFKSDGLGGKPSPLFFGGGHERGVRSGTLNVSGIVGLASALELSIESMNEENNRYREMSKVLINSFLEEVSPAELNGHPLQRLIHNINISFGNVENKALIHAVNGKLAISTGSACTTLNVEPSHVITALGVGAERAYNAVRLGLGRFNTFEEIQFSADYVIEKVKRLRKLKFS